MPALTQGGPGSGGGKNTLKDKLDDDTLDLSLMQLTEVPVKEMGYLTKGTTVDLSNNRLTHLPENFPTLTHIVKLDLSKNQLEELPEYFGQLRHLRHLDLYSNNLARLPVSFAQLKNLKWLDLKNNPLVPALNQAAGPCITAQDCSMCAKKVVALLQSMQSQLERERQRHILEEQKEAAARKAAEEAERERLRAEKRAAKERRREEARAKEAGLKYAGRSDRDSLASTMQHEMEKPMNGDRTRKMNSNASSDKKKSSGWCWSLLMFFLGVFFVSLATGISLLWIYTGGKLDKRSIDAALPVLQRDVEATALSVGKRVEHFVDDTSKALGPFAQDLGAKTAAAWEELQRRHRIASRWAHENFGPTVCAATGSLKRGWAAAQAGVADAWAWLKPKVWEYWQTARPYFQRLGELIIEQSLLAWAWLEANMPVYYRMASEACVQGFYKLTSAIDGLING